MLASMAAFWKHYKYLSKEGTSGEGRGEAEGERERE